MTKDLPEPELLRKLLRYEPETGKLFWLPRPMEMFATERAFKTWNARYAGKEAMPNTHHTGYKIGKLLKSHCAAHRACWAIYYGQWPEEDIDHINGVKTDNRITNLRNASRSVNMRNAAKQKNNKSGYNGVHWHNRDQTWISRIYIDGKRTELGRHNCPTAGAVARKKAERGMGFTERHGK